MILAHSGIAHVSYGKMFEIGMRGAEDEEDQPALCCKQRFALGSYYALALGWVENGAPGDMKELARQYCDLIKYGFEADRS